MPRSSKEARRQPQFHPVLWDTSLGLYTALSLQETEVKAVVCRVQQHNTVQLLHKSQYLQSQVSV